MNAIRKLILILLSLAAAAPVRAADYQLFAHSNLVAWCIVPFDTKKRGPAARGQMLEQLGIKKLAYDWRAEHIPTFDDEVAAMKRHSVEMTAWWFPGALNAEARAILDCIKRNDIHPQLWVMLEGGPHLRLDHAFEDTPAAQAAHVERLIAGVKPIAAEAAKLGCQVALYNHGGWFGVPENQIQIIARLQQNGIRNVGMVYTQHHGHGEIDRFAELFPKMKPYLLAITLNGMIKDGDLQGHDLGTAPLGQGDQDLRLLRIIKESGWHGPVGIILEVFADAETRLLDNLDGLDWLVPQLDGRAAGPKPQPRSWQPPKAASPSSQAGGKANVVEGKPEYRARPITVECRARLNSPGNFNILVASDTKNSAEHWELYSYAGSGVLSLYQPGRGGEFKSEVNICDGQWHHLAAVIEPERVRLFVDGKLVNDTPARTREGQPIPGGLAIGQLVEGTMGCDGVVTDVRLSMGVREFPAGVKPPFRSDAQTIGLWHFDEPPAGATPAKDYWAVEDSKEREKLPLYQTIPAATPEELTPANGFPKRDTYLTWHRSHGDNGGTRYSALDQINRLNVTNLQVAWTYHSQDGSNYIQCNPIIVDGVMFAPTPGKHIVAVNAATGVELWRFKPDGEGKPAFRGLIYWSGRDAASERVMFCAGKFLYALNPKTGQPVAVFGDGGKTLLPGRAQGDFGAATAGPTIFERIIVVPGFEKDAWGFDVVSGKHLWTFHTVPQPGEFGYDTWDRTEPYAANCWAGMAMDEVRGIAYITTGGPKNNFIGVEHRGDNLFANCLIALDARTGKRLWHFQEIRHDIWDLDIPAPPNLATITHDGKRVDVVTAVTKIGNTLLLDRVTGKPIFPFRLRRAPTSELRGEVTSPYQPDPELPEHFSKQEFTAADLTDRTEEAADFALTRFNSATTGWFRPGSEGRANLLFNIDGGAEWTGACIDPDTGRLYVSANHIGWLISIFRNDDPPDDPSLPRTRGQTVFETTCASCHATNRLGIGVAPPLRGLRHRLTDAAVTNQIRTGRNGMPAIPEAQLSDSDLTALLDYLMLRDRAMPATNPPTQRPVYSFAGYPRFFDNEGYPANKPPWGTLNCLDLNTGKLLWKVPLGEFPELTAQGVPKTGTENYGGAIVTAGGLVFCAGTRDRKIRAFDKDTGAELWSTTLPWVGNAPPATYQIDGRQFIVIAATGSKLESQRGDAYVAFALPSAKP
ncbi:MAG: PQQ-binding-like beta-propeller repeat protein [Verrucomicrobia bacterium]|nr:PQQ-binding-like beta-propeller repeat protein [Verrucomicrobiota bacterium]